jgi:hypothetical protein
MEKLEVFTISFNRILTNIPDLFETPDSFNTTALLHSNSKTKALNPRWKRGLKSLSLFNLNDENILYINIRIQIVELIHVTVLSFDYHNIIIIENKIGRSTYRSYFRSLFRACIFVE